ncbi:MAG: FAD-binding oxidoreductase, partial [candidate division Zixibacteria bacterium]|nr:FAD-binding oxidoreductase [candidate division Zixibacteria bacterium]
MPTGETKEKRIDRALKELEVSLGKENASANPAIRSAYRGTNYNCLLPWTKGPKIVVMPKSVEHVQEIVRIANQEKLTILPICLGTQTYYWDTDIVIDMMGMDKILKIYTENSFVLLEPGVTYNRLDPLLREEGYTIAHGSFPSSFSVVANLGVRKGFNHNFSSRMGDQTLGFEIVTPDGTLLRTGSATFKIDYWTPFTQDIPDFRGLFAPFNTRTPLLGILTKAALRIWPMMEARGLPIGGFDTYAKAMKFCQAVAKAGIADQSMVWNWVVVGMSQSRKKGGHQDIDFLNYRLTADYSKPPEWLYYCYTWTQFRGYKEQVELNIKLCERIAREMGGKILSKVELEDTIPDMWKTWELCYKDFSHEKTGSAHAWKMGGEGVMDVWYYIGWVDDLIKLEEGYNRRLKEKHNIINTPYYCRVFESGIGGHLRY